ncbi:MAG: LamG-like jellyroll fold domain-containing protein, partial [Candidatus Zophobacter franzmannii]|nr:LamG-like jellyroll fold domain-containing protein [Candidatus Zophobacter franzmannii]
SINGIDLTPYGTIEYSDDAINGQSVVLDGFSSYLESANSPILNDAALSYTIKVWVKPRIQPVTWAGLVGKPGRNYQIWTHPNGYIHHRFHTTSGTNSGIDNTADGVMNWGQWNCVVITNDGTVGKTYVNGVLESSGTINGDLVADDTPLIFGRHLDGESINNMLDGLIDECTIWNRALGQNELVDLYMDEMIPAGIVQGTIENNDNDPIAYATVEIGSQTIIADALGAYFLYVQPGDYTHTVSAYGYADNTQDITVLPDGDHVIDVMLTDNMDAPDGLSVQNFEFNWNPVELDNRDFHGYHVYLDGNLLGTFTDTTHTFSGLNPDQLYMAGVDAIFTAQTSGIAEIGFVNGTSLEYMNTLDLPLDGDYSEIHGNTPTQILGDLEFRSDAAYDNYLYFHGVNDYLEMLPTDIFGINQSSFTANAWVKLEHDDTNDIAIFGTNFSGATNGGLHLVVRPSRIRMRFYGNDTNVNYPLLTDVWYQITYNYDMDAMTQTIYLNGEQIGQGTNKTPFDNQGTALLIGQADGSRFFTGGMRNIGIWNRSLNQNEIVNLFNDTKPDYGYIVGTVLRAEDNEPMQGVTVTVGEIETMTNSDGYYTLPIVAGTYTVGFRPGLHTEFTVENVSVMIGQETVVDYLYDFTANDDPTQPLLVNALTGLYPNPFNPTTTISFT